MTAPVARSSGVGGVRHEGWCRGPIVGCRSAGRPRTWVFYDNEEVEEHRNGLARITREHAEYPRCALPCFANQLMRASRAAAKERCSCSSSYEESAHSARSRRHNAIHDAGAHCNCWRRTSRSKSRSMGLIYREGLNAVMIKGIDGNVIPDRCVIDVNHRFAPDKSPAEAEAYVRKADGYPIRITDVAAGARPGLDQPAAAEFLRAVGGPASAKLGWTDVARFSAMGIPAVNFGPGGSEEGTC